MIEITPGGDPASESADVLVVPVMADRTWGPGADWVAEELGDYLTGYLDDGEFKGKAGTSISVPTPDRPMGRPEHRSFTTDHADRNIEECEVGGNSVLSNQIPDTAQKTSTD